MPLAPAGRGFRVTSEPLFDLFYAPGLEVVRIRSHIGTARVRHVVQAAMRCSNLFPGHFSAHGGMAKHIFFGAIRGISCAPFTKFDTIDDTEFLQRQFKKNNESYSVSVACSLPFV